MARRKEAHGGGHGWFVTFADLMGLLVSFFVMLVAFSNQDQKKLQIVAGSMRDAFGVQTNVRYSGVIEVDGLPTRPKLKNAAPIPPEEASATPSPDDHGRQQNYGAPASAGHNASLVALGVSRSEKELAATVTRAMMSVRLTRTGTSRASADLQASCPKPG